MKTTCPHCDRLNTQHSALEPDAKPDPGDVSLCWKCGGLAIFTENGVRKPTDDEEAEFSTDPDIKQFRYAIYESIRPSEAIKMVGKMNNFD